MSENLINEFQPSSLEEWKSIVTKDLKGKEYAPTLVKQNEDAIIIDPLFNFENSPNVNQQIGMFPYTRGAKQDNSWKINEDVIFTSPKEGNQKALKALAGGANSITFYGEIKNQDEAKVLLNDIMLEIIETYFSCSVSSCLILSEYLNTYSKTNLIGGFLLEETTEEKLYESPLFSWYNIDGYNFNSKGATPVQEVAISLAKANDLIKQLLDAGKTIDDISVKVKFTLGTSPEYFTEIAKLRAFRTLWANVVKAYNPEYTCSKIGCILSKTSQFYIAGADINTNLLRNTTQAMSSILGGCNVLTILPHNLNTNDDFAQRIARNIQLVLQEEAYLNKVSDPSGGAYFIEYLTEEICNKAWQLFQEIEAKGGYSAFENSGELASLLEQTKKQKQEAIENNSKSVIGVNKHPNKNDDKKITTTFERLTSSFEEKQLVS